MAIFSKKDWLSAKGISELESLVLLGLTNKQIADYMGISAKTLYQWAKENKTFCNALNRSRKEVVNEVVGALYKKCMGYDYEEVVEDWRIVDGEMCLVGKKKNKKHTAPDIQAIIFYLKNRDRENWSERPSEESGGNDAEKIADALREMIKAKKK